MCHLPKHFSFRHNLLKNEYPFITLIFQCVNNYFYKFYIILYNQAMENRINISQTGLFRIQRYSIHDGPGIRTTLFFQGCPLSCQWCHNPESHEKPPRMDSKNLDKIADFLIKEIQKDRIFHDESGGGVTFSGGEPLYQPQLLLKLLDLCSQKQIHTCFDTSGYGDTSVLLTAAEKTDLILYDIKFMDDKTHKKYTGQSNTLILDNLKQLSKKRTAVTLRFPFIPQITDLNDNIGRIIAFIKENTIYRNINILPFHKTGESKYKSLNMKNYLQDIKEPSKEQEAMVKKKFESYGLDVDIGG